MPDNRLRVFVVENSQILAKRIVERLTADARIDLVGLASDAAKAISEVRRLRPDLLIVDIALTVRGGGFEVLRAFATELAKGSMTAIVFTHHSSLPYRDAAIRLGARHFFDKSEDLMRLIKEVANLADHAGRRTGSEG
ncbi:MAG: response regulator [Casimicrobiaceae bacterium]